MGKGNVVLDDSLYMVYHLFKNGDEEAKKSVSIDKISKILKFSGNSVLTNIEQWNRLGLNVDTPLGNRLMYDRAKKSDLKQLSKDTDYKIILTDSADKKDFPYVNIDNDHIEMVLGGFIMRNQSREKAIDHISSLCAKARRVTIYDKYFSTRKKEDENINMLKRLLPIGRKLEITYHKDTSGSSHISDAGKGRLMSELPNWNLQDRMLEDLHDRYLVIDDKLEIILTSGFDYLSDTTKEISYIVKGYKNRFNGTELY